VGARMSLRHTRALLDAALRGDFDEVETTTSPILGLTIPTSCEGVPDEVLNPRDTWDDGVAYDEAARKLQDMFRNNYAMNNYDELGIPAAM